MMKVTKQIEIETDRLLLRYWQKDDLDPLIRLNQGVEVMRFFPGAFDAEKTNWLYKKIQEEFSQYGYGLYATEEKDSGAFIGFIGFHRADLAVNFCPCIEIGWRLDKPYWNKGYATEGARACLGHGFERLGFDEVISFSAVENLPSQRVMQKIGMKFDQHFDHPDIPEGHVLRPHVCYRIERV